MTTRLSDKVDIYCRCGASGSVSSRFLGRRIKCRGCGQVLVAHPPAPEPVARGWREPEHLELLPAVERPVFERPEVRHAERKLARANKSRRTRREAGRLIRHESHARAISFWNHLSAVLGGVGVVVGLVFLGRLGAPLWPLGFQAMFVGLLFALGRGQWTYQTWARWITVALAGLHLALACVASILQPGVGALLALVISGCWDGGVLWVLLSPAGAAVFSPKYRELVARTGTRQVPFWGSPFFYLPVIAGVLAVLLALALIAATIVVVPR